MKPAMKAKAMKAMNAGVLEELSEQQVISCDKTDAGCNGGDLPTAWNYVKKAGGIVKESAYPDTSNSKGKTGSCKSKKLTNKVASLGLFLNAQVVLVLVKMKRA